MGLRNATTMATIRDICHLDNLQDLYYLLKLSPPLKHKLQLQWQHDHMTYDLLPEQEKPTKQLTPSPSPTIAQTVTDETTWQTLHQQILPIISAWCNTRANDRTNPTATAFTMGLIQTQPGANLRHR